jgi:hypothetical protein
MRSLNRQLNRVWVVPKRVVAVAALGLVLSLAVPAGGVRAATNTVGSCSGDFQQSVQQSMLTTTTCNFPANWYRIQGTQFHDYVPANLPPGWQIQTAGPHSVVYFNPSQPNSPNAPVPQQFFINPPGTVSSGDFTLLASPDLGANPVPVVIPFKAKGSFDNPGTKVGVDTDLDAAGKMTIEKNATFGIEIVFLPDSTVSKCDDIAVIQTIRIVDENGDTKYRSDLDADERVPNFEDKDKQAKNADGNAVDVTSSTASNPYYGYGTHGSSDGAGHGKDGAGTGAAHISDAPTILKAHKKWKLIFEDWSVCIAGENAGEFLSGMCWELAWDATAMKWASKITCKDPAKPSDGFKKAVGEWEKAHPGFAQPGTGWKW